MSTRGVLLGEVGPCIEYFEAAVAGGGQLQIVPGIGSGNIGDVAVGVFLAAPSLEKWSC